MGGDFHDHFHMRLWWAVGGAQQLAKLPRIGYLAGAADHKNPTVAAFRQGLRELG